MTHEHVECFSCRSRIEMENRDRVIKHLLRQKYIGSVQLFLLIGKLYFHF